MKLGNFEIGYLSEFAKEYQAMLDTANSLEVLRAGLKKFDPFVWMDAIQVDNWTSNDFLRFKKFLQAERKSAKNHKPTTNTEADMLQFSPIVMPMPMFDVDLKASKLFVPFGCMLIRGIELGVYKIQNERIIIARR